MLNQIDVSFLRLENGREPFKEWLYSLDWEIRKRVILRINRIKSGNFGDFKNLGEGVSELKLDFGSGYRIYFGKHGRNLAILLCRGDKGSQKRDIEKAKKFWREFIL